MDASNSWRASHALRTAVLFASLCHVASQSPCCVQEDFAGPGCTTVDWCNAAEANCEGNCEGVWTVVGDPGGCAASAAVCQPTSPVKCCDPLEDCIDVDLNLNVGTCGTAAPPPPPAPTDPAPAPTPATTPTTAAPPVAGLPTPSSLVRRTYFFGHSLIYHTFTDYVDLNALAVPYWMNEFGSALAGETWLSDGEFRTNNYRLPATNQWGWDPDLSAWDGSFGSTGYDAVVYTELNYVQYKGPNEPYDYDDAHADTPVESLVRIIDYVATNAPNAVIYLYECWDGMNTFPPSAAEAQAHYDSQGISGAYHRWWLDLHEAALALRPDANVVLVPMAPVLAAVLTTYLSDVPFVDLFEDGAPHGRPTVYFLAGLIQYVAMTGERPGGAVLSYAVPDDGSIRTEVVDNFGDLADFVYDQLHGGLGTVSPVAAPTPVEDAPCCVQDGPGCTAIGWCNQRQANCEGDCGGEWTVLGGGPGSSSSPVASSPVAAPVVDPTPDPPVTAPVVAPVEAPTVDEGLPCCIQEDINGIDACTTVNWCNNLQANCEGDCGGVWAVVGAPSPITTAAPPVADPTDPPVPAPVADPTDPPVAAPVDAPSSPPVSSGNPCCIQEAINGLDACTTVGWCNNLQANCEGDCVGVWAVIGGAPSPATTAAPPVAAPVAAPPSSDPPVGSGDEPCCVQLEYAGPGCTTVNWCNAAVANCEGDCVGVWTVVSSNARSLRGESNQ